MSSARLAACSSRALRSVSHPSTRSAVQYSQACRAFSACAPRSNDFTEFNKRSNDTAEEYRRYQLEKPLNPHMTNTASTIANEMPTVGENSDAAPPELISSAGGVFAPKDSVPENTHRMTGGMLSSKDKDVPPANKGIEAGKKAGVAGGELGVGELEGATFKVEPLRRTGEDENTMRARLLYQSRKRGTLESDLLLSTFADANLASMRPELLQQYDLFLDENDWDIYYWATQEPMPTSTEYAERAGPELASPTAQGKAPAKDEWKREPAKGEWAQTVGTFRPAYRPVPSRWRNSEILALLRRHVKERSAGGVMESEAKVEGKGLAQGVKGTGGGGLGMMPEIKQFDK
ncbi:DUF339-domain-containing protein [Lojkania enalia]|uniref:Succinate dehydrogenase assembly factor 2, mitochondrial n=1 Tax=Lojkania enalia TaxID=147567 RepID=A0A9P4K2Z5_9PLEO|nr:DUF339-domain-containing protein [Didymosphaeria enalia]